MASPFFRTLRAVESDGAARRLVPLLLVLLFLGGWSYWFFAVPVAVYESSKSARLEVDRAVHAVDAEVSGRVVSTTLKLGDEVRAGDALVQLDAERERRRIAEEQQRLAGLQPQRDATAREIAAEESALKSARLTARSAVDSAAARKSEGETASRFADDEAERLARLRGKMAELDVLRARAEADKHRAAARALDLDLTRVQSDERTRETLAQAHLEQLRHDLAAIDGALGTTRAQIDVLAQELERHVIRAPVAGRVGAVSPTLQPGAVLREGERVADILPTGQLRIAAQLSPEAALGRVRPGQRARLRLDGFPWTQYGSVMARVDSVDAEPRDGHVRVELAVVSAPRAVPMQHGLPGTLEVEVERVTPATLVLRAAGRVAPR